MKLKNSQSHRRRMRSRKQGLPPGSMEATAAVVAPSPVMSRVTVLEFSAAGCSEYELKKPEDLKALNLTDDVVRWINVYGVRDVEWLKVLGEVLDINALALEDIATTDQRPRGEDYGKNIHILMRVLKKDADELFGFEQLSVILNQYLVVTLQEAHEAADVKLDVLEPLRERIRKGSGIIRMQQEDYVAYRIVDAVLDSYLVQLEGMSESVDMIQEEVLTNHDPQFLGGIHHMRRNLITFKRSIWPLRSVITSMKHSEGDLFRRDTLMFLRDASEHVEQIIDIIETMNENLSSALEIFLTNMNNRLNEIMRLLTVLSAFFIPLTFIVGVYGMNFRHMPELEWHYGYYSLWGIMLAIVVGMFIFFRRRRWL